MKNRLVRIDPTVQEIKRFITMYAPPRNMQVRRPRGGAEQIVEAIWVSIKKNHTRKQTIKIINNMPLDEIEEFLARWKLERSIGE